MTTRISDNPPPVNAVQTTATVNSQSVNQVSLSATLTRPSEQLRFQISRDTSPMDDELAINVQRVDRAVRDRRIFLYNDLGTSVHYRGLTQTQEQDIGDVYGELKALVNPNATNMRFYLATMTVSYSENGVSHTEDMLEHSKNPEIERLYRKLEGFVRPVWRAPLRNQFVERQKISENSPLPFKRTTETLQKLPSDYIGCAKLALDRKTAFTADPDKALKWIVTGECILAAFMRASSNMITSLATQKGVLEGEKAAAPANDQESYNPRIAAVTRQIQDLEKKKKELEEIDRAALYTALASYPTKENPTATDIVNAVYATKRKLQQYLDEQQKALEDEGVKYHPPGVLKKVVSLFPESIVGKMPRVLPRDSAYAADAAALIFSARPIAEMRKEYFEFIRQQPSLLPKVLCPEDSLVGFALGRTDTIPELASTVDLITDPALKRECTAAIREAIEIRNGGLPLTAEQVRTMTLDQKIEEMDRRYHLTPAPPAPNP